VTETIERIARIGPDERLVGVVTLPATPRPGAPGLLLLNAGVVHRIGPHRLNVKLARALAQDGVISIRIDLSGLGDSPAAAGATHSGEQSLRDLKAAMSHLEQAFGIRRFVVFGLCSGAVNAYRLALADERIAGLLMFDGYVFPTWKTHARRRLARLHSLPWSAIAAKTIQLLAGRRPRRQPIPGEDSDDTVLGAPTRLQFADAMKTLVTRGTSVYLVYSGSFLEGHNYHGQLRDGFGHAMFLDHIRYDYLPNIDHTVTSLAAQREVLAAVRDWVQSVPAEAGVPARSAAVEPPASTGSTGSSIQESLSPP
jgi:dienelactone hydrolase